MVLKRTPIAVLVAAAGLAAPAAAQAATITPLGPCYRSVDEVERETVPVQAQGYTPGALVDVFVDGVKVEENILVDDFGNVSGSVDAPYQPRGEREFTVTVTQQDTPENTATVASRVAALGLRLKPRRTAPSRRVRFLGLGFIDGTEVFAHYVRAGRHRKTVSLGAPKGPCGRVSVRRRQIPLARPRTGRGTHPVDNQRVYSPAPPTVTVRVPINVRRVVGPSRLVARHRAAGP
jgi:hypothetical protein